MPFVYVLLAELAPPQQAGLGRVCALQLQLHSIAEAQDAAAELRQSAVEGLLPALNAANLGVQRLQHSVQQALVLVLQPQQLPRELLLECLQLSPHGQQLHALGQPMARPLALLGLQCAAPAGPSRHRSLQRPHAPRGATGRTQSAAPGTRRGRPLPATLARRVLLIGPLQLSLWRCSSDAVHVAIPVWAQGLHHGGYPAVQRGLPQRAHCTCAAAT
mmetsp:Transcript_53716/g.172175  ORF Transcript_53716/g.172175 Transcript_53716/m.172175 type:complete len:217 (+) Transcript_53716:2130-2780(+)